MLRKEPFIVLTLSHLSKCKIVLGHLCLWKNVILKCEFVMENGTLVIFSMSMKRIVGS